MALQIAIGPDTNNQTEVDRRYLGLRDQLLTHDGLAHIQPPQPLIEGWLYQNSLAWLGGKPGDGKSFIAIDFAYSVATGKPWQGHPTTQGTVLYLAAEGASGLSIRANAWCQANGNPDSLPIWFLPLSIALKAPHEIDVQAFNLLLQDIQPALVIIDTQARVTVGAEENSAKDMGFFIDALETLRASNPATYLTVHHTPRNGENLRGSIALEGAAETVLISSKDGDLLTLKCSKQKNAAEPPDLDLYMQPIGDSIVVSHEAVGVIEISKPAEDQLLRLIWEQYGSNEVSNSELIAVSGLANGPYYRALNPLVNKGKILRNKVGRSTYLRCITKP